MRKTLVSLMTAALLVSAVSPAYAHTQEEYDVWVLSWSEEVLANGGLTMSALDELHEMEDNHPCLAEYCAPPKPAGPTTSVANHTYSAGVEQWRPTVEAYFNAGDVAWALAVIRCESGGNPSAKNSSSSASGLFQHLAKFWPERSSKAGLAGADIFDPTSNIAVGAWLFYNGGSSHWSASRGCWG